MLILSTFENASSIRSSLRFNRIQQPFNVFCRFLLLAVVCVYVVWASLLIVVVVMIDFITQVQSHLFQHQYEGLLKKTKLKGRR